MSGGLVTAAYIVAAILFIFSLAGLSKHETSQQGNYFGIAGMAIALIATILGPDAGNVGWIILAMVIGGAIGIRLAKKVEMTEMPELVAILHSFVGLAAVLVGFNSYLQHETGMEHVCLHQRGRGAHHQIRRAGHGPAGEIPRLFRGPVQCAVPAGDDRDRAGLWLAPGGLYRRCGHAGGGLDAQLLLGLGGSGSGLYAEQ